MEKKRAMLFCGWGKNRGKERLNDLEKKSHFCVYGAWI